VFPEDEDLHEWLHQNSFLYREENQATFVEFEVDESYRFFLKGLQDTHKRHMGDEEGWCRQPKTIADLRKVGILRTLENRRKQRQQPRKWVGVKNEFGGTESRKSRPRSFDLHDFTSSVRERKKDSRGKRANEAEDESDFEEGFEGLSDQIAIPLELRFRPKRFGLDNEEKKQEMTTPIQEKEHSKRAKRGHSKHEKKHVHRNGTEMLFAEMKLGNKKMIARLEGK